MERMKATLLRALRLGAALSLPAAVGLVVLAQPLVAALFEHGAFTSHDSRQTAQALMAYCVGLAAYAGVKVLVPAFYALGDTRTPLVASFLALAANLSLNLLLYRSYGHVGLALAVSLTSLFNFVQLWWWLGRKLDGLPTRAFGLAVLRVLGASLAMGGVLGAAVHWLRPYWEAHLWAQIAVSLGGVAGGGVALLLFYRIFGVEERHDLWRVATGLLRRLGGRGRSGQSGGGVGAGG